MRWQKSRESEWKQAMFRETVLAKRCARCGAILNRPRDALCYECYRIKLRDYQREYKRKYRLRPEVRAMEKLYRERARKKREVG